MNTNASQIINALVEAEIVAEQSEQYRYCPKGNVVTVAHDLGSGGRAIARKLAERLGVEYYDQQILDAIVEVLPKDRAILERLDRHVSTTWEEVMHDIVTGRSAVDEYRHHLIQIILAIARKSGVIMGRGAHLILARYKVFRVYILGSPEVCARRLVKQERIGLDTPLTLDEAKRRVLQAREDNAAFVRQLFARYINDPGVFDLMINTDLIPVEAAPDIILSAMKRAGFSVSKEPTARRSRILAAA